MKFRLYCVQWYIDFPSSFSVAFCVHKTFAFSFVPCRIARMPTIPLNGPKITFKRTECHHISHNQQWRHAFPAPENPFSPVNYSLCVSRGCFPCYSAARRISGDSIGHEGRRWGDGPVTVWPAKGPPRAHGDMEEGRERSRPRWTEDKDC